jgi:hypothetical protein
VTDAGGRVAMDSWPALPRAEWEPTLQTLHLWTQIVGKTRLGLAPMTNHWWHCTLYVTPRGLATSAMPSGQRALDIEFDLLADTLVMRTSDGGMRTMPLAPRTVADFYREYRDLLASLGVNVRIWPVPCEIADPIRFTDDTIHADYDADAARRCWRILLQADRLFRSFRSRFVGKVSPVHFWWGGFDLACTRFSGRVAPPHPGGLPNIPDYVTREGYSHECISAGWWPGGPDGEAEFYAYAYPEPPGCRTAPIRPSSARYDLNLHEWILPYGAVRTASDPDGLLMDFLQSTYEAAADLGRWDRAGLERGK